MKEIKAGIVGYSGYTGEALTKYLCRHKHTQPYWINVSRHEQGKTNIDPYNEKALNIARLAMSRGNSENTGVPVLSADQAINEALDVIFLATPIASSLELVPWFLNAGMKVIDLSGAFRIQDADEFLNYYDQEHPCPDILKTAHYGLSELQKKDITTAQLIANPGCHATAANLALAPLAENNLIDRRSGVVCDSKTGASGAGKKARAATHFCSISENVQVYAGMEHRHTAEICQLTGLRASELSFSAHLLPYRFGLMATLYLRLPETVDFPTVGQAYASSYAAKPFIQLLQEGAYPNIASVAGTNYCRLGYNYLADGRRLLVVSVIDNIIKGAAGQAIQNMNLMFTFDETESLV